MFGPERGRNDYSLRLKLSDEDRRELESLYCAIYQKAFAPNHMAKELAIGWIFQHVRGEPIDWAQFAAETNQVQHANYRVRVKTWLRRLQALGDKEINVKIDLQKFLNYTDEKPLKFLLAKAFKQPSQVLLENEDKKPKFSSVVMPSVNFDMLASR